MRRLRSLILTIGFLLGLAAPASSQFGGVIVQDPLAITKIIAEIQQTLNLVNMAKQNLQTLPTSVALTNLQGRISSVTGLLTQAQSLCQGALNGKNLPSACQVQANVANVQAAQLPANAASLQQLQANCASTTGALQAQQCQANATLAVASMIQAQQTATIAAAQQKQIDANALKNALTGNSAGDPYGQP